MLHLAHQDLTQSKNDVPSLNPALHLVPPTCSIIEWEAHAVLIRYSMVTTHYGNCGTESKQCILSGKPQFCSAQKIFKRSN